MLAAAAAAALAQLRGALATPERRAFWGAWLVAMWALASLSPRRRPPLLVALIAAELAGNAARLITVRLADDTDPVVLHFHGADCPGHTTGLPGASCLDPVSGS